MMMSRDDASSIASRAARIEVLTGMRRRRPLSWSRLFGQFDGEVKLIPGIDHAASWSVSAGGASPASGLEIDAFILQRAPQPLDEHIVHPAASTIHAEADLGVLQYGGEGEAGELAALVGVEDVGGAVTDRSACVASTISRDRKSVV